MNRCIMLTVASGSVAVKRRVWSAEGSLLYKACGSPGDNDPFVVAPLNGRVPQQTVWAISNPSTEPQTLRAHRPLQRNTTPTICTSVMGHSVPSCDQVSAARCGRYKLNGYFSKLSRQAVGFTSNCFFFFFTLVFFSDNMSEKVQKRRGRKWKRLREVAQTGGSPHRAGEKVAPQHKQAASACQTFAQRLMKASHKSHVDALRASSP